MSVCACLKLVMQLVIAEASASQMEFHQSQNQKPEQGQPGVEIEFSTALFTHCVNLKQLLEQLLGFPRAK